MAAAKKTAKKKAKSGEQKRLSDAEIVELWEEREAIRLRVKKLQALQAKRDQAILAELDIRGTHAIENGGHRVTRVQNETVSYDGWGIVKKLRQKRRRDVADRLIKEVVDNSALAAELQAGNIDPSLVAEFSSVNLSKPYLKGSITGRE